MTMASIEQINTMSKNASAQDHWGIDKKIPVALIFVVIIQTLGFTWGAATLSNDVRNNGKTIEKLESRLENFITKVERDLGEKRDANAARREVDKIGIRLDRLEERLLIIERNPQ